MVLMSEEPHHATLPFTLLAIVSVSENERVQCQHPGCGHGVYAAIHMVLVNDDIQCWGSTCYGHEAGMIIGQPMKALYPSLGGRKLTSEERALLQTNRDLLIEHFKAEHEEKIRQEQEALRVEEARRAETEAKRLANPIEEFFAAQSPSVSSLKPQAPFTLTRIRHPLPTMKIPAADYNKPQPREPMDDPRYRAIREDKIKQWLRRGIDLTRQLHYSSLIDNCLQDYERGSRT